jgi:hypothetical protein
LKSSAKGLGLGAVVLAFILVAIVRFDVVVSVRYLRAKVIAVRYLPQYGTHYRAVLVNLGDRDRVIHTSSFDVRTDVGAKVCVGDTAFLLRRFKSFCPGMTVLAPPVDGPSVMLPGD